MFWLFHCAVGIENVILFCWQPLWIRQQFCSSGSAIGMCFGKQSEISWLDDTALLPDEATNMHNLR